MVDPVILWLRQDLRPHDNPALTAAAQRWWLHHSLAKLEKYLEDNGLKLILRSGYAASVLRELCDATGAKAIHDPEAYGCRPDSYPARIIGHREARVRALEAGKKAR